MWKHSKLPGSHLLRVITLVRQSEDMFCCVCFSFSLLLFRAGAEQDTPGEEKGEKTWFSHPLPPGTQQEQPLR